MSDLTIVISANNHHSVIGKTLYNYANFFSKQNFVTKIIVVVSDSTDNTYQICNEYSLQYPNIIKVIKTNYLCGKGGSIALGFLNSNSKYIGYIDPYGSVRPTEFLKLYTLISDTPTIDGVIGNRFNKNSKISFFRKILSKSYNFYSKIVFELNYKDIQCDAKIYKNNVAKDLASKLSSTEWAFDVNLLLINKYLNHNIKEVKINWVQKEGAKFSIINAFLNIPTEFFRLKRLEINYLINLKNIFTKQKNNELKNILIYSWRDIKHPQSGGSEIYIHEVFKRLSKNYNITLFTSKTSNLNNFDNIDNINIYRKGGFLTVYLWAFIYYFKFFKETTDVILDVENGIPFFTPLYSNKPKVLLIHHVHKNQWYKQFNFIIATIGMLLENLLMPILYKNTKVITVSPSSLNDISKLGFKQKNIFIGYNSIPLKSKNKYSKSKHPLFLYHGRLKNYKRIDLAIKSFKKLLKKYPNAKFIITGAGDIYNSLKNLVNTLGISNSVELKGYVSDKEKWDLMHKSWVFLMPSLNEGWGITIIEAASCGTPAIGFEVSGIKDSIIDKTTGLLSKNQKEFEKNIISLVEDAEYREYLGENAKRWAKKFTWDKSSGLFKLVFETVLKNKNNHLLSSKIYPWSLLSPREIFLDEIK